MPTTPTFNLPYPSLTDAPNGPSQIQALAAAVDTAMAGLSGPVVAQIQFSGSNALSNNGGLGAFAVLTGWNTATIGPTGGITWTTSGIAVVTAGYYMAGGEATFEVGDGTGRRGVAYSVNGSTVGGGPGASLIAGTVVANVPAPARLLQLNAGDVVSLSVFQSSGGTLHVTAAELSLHLVR